MGQRAYLLLEKRLGIRGGKLRCAKEVTGELVFTTAMTGYLETLTDLSYYGQIVVQTFPLIGNYGVIPKILKAKAAAYGVYCQTMVSGTLEFQKRGDLATFLNANGIVGLAGVDTRRLTRIVRESGVMNARVLLSPPDVEAELPGVRAYRVENAVRSVSSLGEYAGDDGAQGPPRGAVGFRRQAVNRKGAGKTRLPCFLRTPHVSAEDILSLNPDGVMLSNGPGDPAENVREIEQLRTL